MGSNMTVRSTVEISRFKRGNQGELVRESVTKRAIFETTLLESSQIGVAQTPMTRRKVRYILYMGQRYEVRGVDPQSTFLPDVKRREEGIFWTLSLAAKTR